MKEATFADYLSIIGFFSIIIAIVCSEVEFLVDIMRYLVIIGFLLTICGYLLMEEDNDEEKG